MQTLSATRTAVLLLAIVMATAGCGARATGSVGSPTETSPATEARTSTSTTSTTIADVARGGEVAKPAGQEVTPPTTLVPAVPEQAVEEIDSMIDGLDTTLAELDQLLNQAAAALAAEEGEIIP